MKKLKLIWKTICQFFYGFTKAGKEEKYYAEALKNMQGPEALEKFEKRLLQKDINLFLNHKKEIRTLPADAKISLARDKFKKQLDKYKLTICPETKKLIGV